MQPVDIRVIIINYIPVPVILELVRRHIQVDTSVIDKCEGICAEIVVDQRVGVSKQFRNRVVSRF